MSSMKLSNYLQLIVKFVTLNNVWVVIYCILYLNASFQILKRTENNSRQRSLSNLQIRNISEGNGISNQDLTLLMKCSKLSVFLSFFLSLIYLFIYLFIYLLDHRINFVCRTNFILIWVYFVMHFSFSEGYMGRNSSLWCIIWQVRVIDRARL
jgi:hypothetical protein